MGVSGTGMLVQRPIYETESFAAASAKCPLPDTAIPLFREVRYMHCKRDICTVLVIDTALHLRVLG